jgi:hypothetical protein
MELKYHHIGIPTGEAREGEKYLERDRVHVSGYATSDYGIEWLRFDPDCPLPAIVKTIPHIAFEVDDVNKAVEGKDVIMEPNSPADGILSAFIEENGAPVEFIQITSRDEELFQRRDPAG